MFPTFTLRYARLPSHFFEPFIPVAVEKPALVAFNRELAETLGPVAIMSEALAA